MIIVIMSTLVSEAYWLNIIFPIILITITIATSQPSSSSSSLCVCTLVSGGAQWPLVVSHCLTHCCRLGLNHHSFIIIFVILVIIISIVIVMMMIIITIISSTFHHHHHLHRLHSHHFPKQLMQGGVSTLSTPTAKSVTPFFKDKQIKSSSSSSSLSPQRYQHQYISNSITNRIKIIVV